MRVLDLFSGIGGFSLGLERAGFRTVAFCEIDPYCRRVLARHWPDVPCYEDIQTVSARRLAADRIAVDAICGGFPCQDISLAGPGGGISGRRSGLWFHMLRLIGEIRPRWAIIENTSVIRSRGLETVLGGLAALGYDAEWHCIPAAAVGAPHRRDRVWIVAYPAGERRHGQHSLLRPSEAGRVAADLPEAPWGGPDVAHPDREGLEVLLQGNARQLAASLGTSPWAAEPDVGRVAYGVPARVDRLRCLGNAVVPQIPEIIGRAILAAEAAA